MNYTLNQLRIFSKIVETKSITKASDELHLTQPAVSIQLKKFQEQFDIPLTEVVGRKIYITQFGAAIAQIADKILADVHLINYKNTEFKGKIAGKLEISIVSTGKYIMPFYLSSFIKQNPSIDLNINVTNRSTVIKDLEENKVDLALVSLLPETIEVEKLDLISNRLYPIANKGVHTTETDNLKTILENIPLIFREKGSGTRQVMEKHLLKQHLELRKKLELSSNEAVKQAVLAGLGFSIMPLIGIKNELLNRELKILPVSGFPIVSNWSLIWPKGKGHSPVASALIQHIRKEKNTIIQEHFDWYENY